MNHEGYAYQKDLSILKARVDALEAMVTELTAHNSASDEILLCTYTGDDCHAKNGDRCMCDNPCKYRKTSHVA